MSILKEETIKGKDYVRRTYACDLCGDDLTEGNFVISEVEIQCKEGRNFPEGGSYEGVKYDCCVRCFEHKVAPVLKDLGFKPRKIEADF